MTSIASWCWRSRCVRIALTLGLGLIAAWCIHFARTYPWYRLYLSDSKLDQGVLYVNAPANVSQEGPCFVPRKAASKVIDGGRFGALPIGLPSDTLGLEANKCFLYAARLEPYLAPVWRNDYIVKAQERLGLQDKSHIPLDLVWYANMLAENQQNTYRYINWSELALLHNCADRAVASEDSKDKPRLAFVLRSYQDFQWSLDAILHLRALIWELKSATTLPFIVDVHILLEVKDAASYASMFTRSGRMKILRGCMPIEFWSMVTLWHANEMALRYPIYSDSKTEVATGSYRGCLLPLQRFAVDHSKYQHFINWELDARFTHTYDQLVGSIYSYAFRAGGQKYTQWHASGADQAEDGSEMCRNKPADVIVLSPVRNPQDSGWYWENDVQGYPALLSTTRAASVGTNLWLSRRALLALENTTANEQKSLFCEAMAPTLAFQPAVFTAEKEDGYCEEGVKLIHYPHSMAFKYEATPYQLDKLLNPTQATLAKHNEEPLKDTSYYYASSIAQKMYEWWRKEKKACIAAMILHPIKSVSHSGSLCDDSSDGRCEMTIGEDVERYTGIKLDPPVGTRSLYRWQLERPRYVGQRRLIMNSSTRSLIITIMICVLAAGAVHFVGDQFKASRGSGSQRNASNNGYVALVPQ